MDEPVERSITIALPDGGGAVHGDLALPADATRRRRLRPREREQPAQPPEPPGGRERCDVGASARC